MGERKEVRDAVEILERRFVDNNPEMRELLEAERTDLAIGQHIYALRSAAGLTQEQLAEKVGTTQSVISRLEQADYEGHTSAMLNRIAAAVGYRASTVFLKDPEEAHLMMEFQEKVRELRRSGWNYFDIREKVRKFEQW
jgi:transcriptional regulator with XRE-family HTH domain